MGGLLLRTSLSRRVSLQRGGNVPFYRGPVLQRGYRLGSIFKSVAKSVMTSLKEIGKSALTNGLEVLQDVSRCVREYQNSSKETSERKQSSIPRQYCFWDGTQKYIKGSRNKQIVISSSKPKKRKHQSGELDNTIFSKLTKERN